MTDRQSAPRPTPEARREQILAAARARFLADGYVATPISAIVAAAGVAQGTFYLYFESKQALLTELRREVLRDYEQALADVAARPGPADARLVDAIVAIAAAVVRHRELIAVFRAADRVEATERAVLDGRARLARRALPILEQGIRDGIFHDEHPELTAQLIVTLFDNVLYEALAWGRPAALPEAVAHGVAFTLKAVGADAACVSRHVAAVARDWSLP